MANAATEESRVEDDSSDSWETDEEQLVHVQLSGIFQDDLAGNPALLTKFVGLDSAAPVVQIGNQVFAGQYENTLGTSVFFKAKSDDANDGDDEAESEDKEEDPVFSPRPQNKIEFVHKTDRKLVLKRVFLNKKKAGNKGEKEGENNADETSPEKEKQR